MAANGGGPAGTRGPNCGPGLATCPGSGVGGMPAGLLSRPLLDARRCIPDDELAAVDLLGVGERRKLDLTLGIGEGDLGSSLTLNGGGDLSRSLASSLEPWSSRRPRSASVCGRRGIRRSSRTDLTAGFGIALDDVGAPACVRITKTRLGSGLLSGNIGRDGFVKVPMPRARASGKLLYAGNGTTATVLASLTLSAA